MKVHVSKDLRRILDDPRAARDLLTHFVTRGEIKSTTVQIGAEKFTIRTVSSAREFKKSA